MTTATTHSCGVTTAHVAYCSGGDDGTFGYIGDGSMTRRLTPVPVAGNLVFSSVGIGRIHSCGLTTDGHAFCWGRATRGKSVVEIWSAVPFRIRFPAVTRSSHWRLAIGSRAGLRPRVARSAGEAWLTVMLRLPIRRFRVL